jgi:hypothetical protein
MTRKMIIFLTLIATLAVTALPVFAQDTATRTGSRTFTRTEAEINESYWVTNPRNRAVSDMEVDLQEGQVVIDTTYTRRRQEAMSVSVTAVPTIENGRVYWSVTEATSDGTLVADDLLAQINAHINASWRNYWRRQAPAGYVTDISINDSKISVTLARRS